MANVEASHDTVLDAGTVRSRLARTYAEALLVAASKQSANAEALADELAALVSALGADAGAVSFLADPTVGRRAKAAALEPALKGHASDLVRGLVSVLTRNGRLDLLRGVSAALRRLLDDRAGRVRVRVATATPLSDTQKSELTASLKSLLGNREPVLDVRTDPDLLGGLVVQVGDSVHDTSVRSRLQSIRSLLLAR